MFFSCTKNYQNYIPYYHAITTAETYIAAGKYDSALLVYDRMDNDYTRRFWQDLHNACLCAIETDDMKKARYYAEKLINHGYTLKDFEKEGFAAFKDTKQWNKLKNKYPKLRKKFENKINEDLRSQYYQLYLNDRNAVKETLVSPTYTDSVFFYQAQQLKNLIHQYGFPEVYVQKDTMKAKIHILLRHYFGLINRLGCNEEMYKYPFYANLDFENNLTKKDALNWLKNGLIKPADFTSMTDHWDCSNEYGKLAWKLDFDKEEVSLFFPMKPEQINMVNTKRKSIGLPAIDTVSSFSKNIVKSTWLAHYPFKEIKEALLACDTCKSYLDYLRVHTSIKETARLKYADEKKSKVFILPSLNNIRDYYSMGSRKYCKNVDWDALFSQ